MRKSTQIVLDGTFVLGYFKRMTTMKVYIVFKWGEYPDDGPDIYGVYDSREKADAVVEKMKQLAQKAQKLRDEYDTLLPQHRFEVVGLRRDR